MFDGNICCVGVCVYVDLYVNFIGISVYSVIDTVYMSHRSTGATGDKQTGGRQAMVRFNSTCHQKQKWVANCTVGGKQ